MNTQYTIADLMKVHYNRAITRMEQQALKDIEQYILHAIATAESRLYESVLVWRSWRDPNCIVVDLLPLTFPGDGEFSDMFEMDIRIPSKDKYVMFLGNALKKYGF